MRERLIGAVVLVVAAVILIPWLVAHSHHPRERVASLPLPPMASADGPAVLALPPLPISARDAAAEGGEAAAIEPAAAPQVTSRRAPATTGTPPKPASPPVEAAAKDAPVAHAGDWYVQVASVSSRTGAGRLVAELAKADFPAFISAHEVEGKTWYRVRVGPYADGAKARAAAAKLQAARGSKVIVRQVGGSDG